MTESNPPAKGPLRKICVVAFSMAACLTVLLRLKLSRRGTRCSMDVARARARARSERVFVALAGVINGHSQFSSGQISTRRLFWRSVKYNVNFAKPGKTFIPQ